MTRRKVQESELMEATEELLLEQGYGGFNFSALANILRIGRSTLYEYYPSKDDLIVAYMNKLMISYTSELHEIVTEHDAKAQLFRLIELMIKYAHIHSVLKIIPLLQNDSESVKEMKENFVTDHLLIIKEIQTIINYGKEKEIIRKEIPTDVLVNLLFNTINKPSSLKMDNYSWAKWVWAIIYDGVKTK